MTSSTSLPVVALLMSFLMLAPVSADAHTSIPENDEIVASRIMATGPLNVVMFRVSLR